MPTAAVSAVPRLPQRVAAVVYALAFRRPSSSWSPRCPAPAFSPFSLALQRLHRPSTSDRLFGFGTAAIRTRGTAPCAGPPFQSEALPTVLAAVDVSAESPKDTRVGNRGRVLGPAERLGVRLLGFSRFRLTFSIFAFVCSIETSCDDTAVAVINSRREILSERIHHQTTIHEPLGGIYPHAAAASHALELPALVRQALDDARLDLKDLDAVAVTRGPGISPCLAVGINVACALAAVARKPIVAVNHMEAHALTPRFSARKPPSFPFLALLISGGHTMIVLAEDVGQYKVLAASGDESVGEAFDKTARLLRIPWLHGVGGPAGAALELVAERGNPDAYLFPVPMSTNHGKRKMAFSYSGLRTEVERLLAKWNVDVTDPAVAPDVAAS
ncbi:MAG: glycoprotease family-domain-containing protein, partial [Olpidium bornovanus]